jgi:hypothetical protein
VWLECTRMRIGTLLSTAAALLLFGTLDIQGAIGSLNMKRTATPFFRGDVGDSLSEVPAVAIEILSIVLALPVRVVCRFGEDDGSILPRALTVTVGVLDADLNDM